MITVLLFAALMIWMVSDHLKVMRELRQLRTLANTRTAAETHSQ